MVVPDDLLGAWLDPQLTDTDEVQRLLAPMPEPRLVPHVVSRAVNNVVNNGPQLRPPAEVDRAAGTSAAAGTVARLDAAPGPAGCTAAMVMTPIGSSAWRRSWTVCSSTSRASTRHGGRPADSRCSPHSRRASAQASAQSSASSQ